jgi:hypothetical protein
MNSIWPNTKADSTYCAKKSPTRRLSLPRTLNPRDRSQPVRYHERHSDACGQSHRCEVMQSVSRTGIPSWADWGLPEIQSVRDESCCDEPVVERHNKPGTDCWHQVGLADPSSSQAGTPWASSTSPFVKHAASLPNEKLHDA